MITITNDAPATFPLGTTVVTWTATDASGNTSTCTQTVIVKDATQPTISCAGNINQGTSAGSCDASVATPDPTIADNCGTGGLTLTWAMTGATTATSPATGINNVGTKTFNVGVTTITYTVKDAAGNTSTCSSNTTNR
ncbi:MAG: HYR domain-containing protein [Cytophagaceae bacterium]|nr:MAG: HYR domain-containing protein [Cytophagaceae bacterium]